MTTIQDNLNKILQNIQQQQIRLIHIDMDANEKRGGMFSDKILHTQLDIPLKRAGVAEVVNNKNETMPIIYADYDFFLKYSLKPKSGNTSNELEEIITLQATYNISIFLKDEIRAILGDDENIIKESLNIFFDNTGRIIVYPYFRNITDILVRESGFILPPLPPLKINNEAN